MRGTLPVGRILGIPILVNPSWFASLFLIVGVLSLRAFPSSFPGQDNVVYWSLGIAGGILFFLSILLHELGHCVVARHYGIPVNSITLFIFGGVSQISHDAPRPRAEFLMALAGPAVSLVLGGLLVGLGLGLLNLETPLGQLVVSLGGINLVLGVFNLLPGFPMDGGRVLRSLIWGISGNLRLATRLAALLGRATAFLLIGVGIATILQVPYVSLGADPIGGLWTIFVGLFLNRAAAQTQRQTRLLNYLRDYRADQIMESDVPTVPAGATVRAFIQDLATSPGDGPLFVVRDERVAGVLSRERVQQVPVSRWAEITAGDLMIPADNIAPASPDDDAATLLQRMDAEGLPGLPVVSAGAVAGMVTRAGLFRLLRGNRRLRPLRL